VDASGLLRFCSSEDEVDRLADGVIPKLPAGIQLGPELHGQSN
jgi:hypothetical protein